MNTNEFAEEKKQGIFVKILGFIKRIFKSNPALPAPDVLDIENTDNLDVQNASQEGEIATSSNEVNIISELKVEPIQEDAALLDLQKKFECNQITLAELSDEDLNSLNDLYLRQIDDLNFQLNNVNLN